MAPMNFRWPENPNGSGIRPQSFKKDGDKAYTTRFDHALGARRAWPTVGGKRRAVLSRLSVIADDPPVVRLLCAAERGLVRAIGGVGASCEGCGWWCGFVGCFCRVFAWCARKTPASARFSVSGISMVLSYGGVVCCVAGWVSGRPVVPNE